MRKKAHWDYLLEEMRWLAADFAQERKWKKAAARKVHFYYFLILFQVALKQSCKFEVSFYKGIQSKNFFKFFGQKCDFLCFCQETKKQIKLSLLMQRFQVKRIIHRKFQAIWNLFSRVLNFRNVCKKTKYYKKPKSPISIKSLLWGSRMVFSDMPQLKEISKKLEIHLFML